MNIRKNFAADSAENSIMQTITIAVSAILIASGLVTAPGLINNARDNNATGDLANIAYAQEFLLSNQGIYTPLVNPELADASGWYLGKQEGVKYSLSEKTSSSSALVCNDPQWAYLLQAKSKSGQKFYRASTSAKTSTKLSELNIPACITALPEYIEFSGGLQPLSFTTATDLGSTAVSAATTKTITTNSPSAGTAVVMAVTSGTLPPGMTFTNGVLSGTPSTAGSYTFTVSAIRGSENISRTFTIAISLGGNAGWKSDMIVNATPKAWSSVTMSANGQTIIGGVVNGTMYMSKDGGTTWTQPTLPALSGYNPNTSTNKWRLDVSDDGNKILVGAAITNTSSPTYSQNYVYFSPDAGETWTTILNGPPSQNVYAMTAVSLSSDGNTCAVAYDSYVYTNTGKNNCTALSSISRISFGKPASLSVTNGRIVIGEEDGRIEGSNNAYSQTSYRSPNNSPVYVTNTSGTNYFGLSADGTVAKTVNGTTWTTVAPNVITAWSSVTSSAYGVVATDTSNTLYSSSDGVTWTNVQPHDGYKTTQASVSADGHITAIAVDASGKGYIFIK